MVAQVTLDIFSGRSNPSWAISDEKADELFRQISALREEPGTLPPDWLGKLGYRGFHVTRSRKTPDGVSSVFIYDRLVDEGKRGMRRVSRNREIETRVLETSRDSLDEELKDIVWSELSGSAIWSAGTAAEPRGIYCPPCFASDAPAYTPGPWNSVGVQPNNNCYNYANDQVTRAFAQPGRASGVKLDALDCGSVDTAAQADGLARVPGFGRSLASGQGWYVALVIWPGWDYHWYRQDGGGCWSHKPGATSVADIDNAGTRIADPRSCDRGPYAVFCTFMTTDNNVVLM